MPNHIVTRGNNRRRLFSYPRDYRSFLWHLGRAVQACDCELNSVCLMTNHVHALITPPSVKSASECVKMFSQRYAQLRNRAKSASGKLFEQRFFSEPIESEEQLALTTMYIDANPLRAGLVRDAAEYPWSTYALHIAEAHRGEVPASIWTPSAWYRGLGETPETRARRYAELFTTYVSTAAHPDHADRVKAIEALSHETYRHRLRRPDESRVADRVRAFGRSGPGDE